MASPTEQLGCGQHGFAGSWWSDNEYMAEFDTPRLWRDLYPLAALTWRLAREQQSLRAGSLTEVSLEVVVASQASDDRGVAGRAAQKAPQGDQADNEQHVDDD